MNTKTSWRSWVVRWLYGVAMIHLLVGMLLPWVGSFSVLEGYHRHVEATFWNAAAPAAARTQQIWWIALFGPTMQSVALWMGALIHLGDRHRSCFAWAALIVGVAVWAPQDIGISLQAGAWVHVWIDIAALVTLLPPLVGLILHDRKPLHSSAHSTTTKRFA